MININVIGKALLFFGIVGALTACSTVDVMQDKAVRIDGEVYYYNEAGEIELTEEELRQMESSGNIVRIKHVAPTGALILDPEEMTVLMQDRAVFYSELDKKNPSGEVSVLIKKGSLRKNLERIIKEEGWEGVAWNSSVDYYVPKPFAIVGPDVQTVVIEALNGYPVYVNFDVTGKSIEVAQKAAATLSAGSQKDVFAPATEGVSGEKPGA